jgi:hypothetical protein
MVANALCNGCMMGEHERHVEDHAPAPEGVMGGFRCPCTGECDGNPVKTFHPVTDDAMRSIIAVAAAAMGEEHEVDPSAGSA